MKSVLLIAICVITLGVKQTNAQCIRDDLKANAVRGQVLMPDKKPLAGVSIKLFRGEGEEKKVIYAAVSDSTGAFAIPAVKMGKYLLVVSGSDFFDSIWSDLRVTRPPDTEKSDFLEIELGPTKASSSDSCEGTIKLSMRR